MQKIYATSKSIYQYICMNESRDFETGRVTFVTNLTRVYSASLIR